MAGSIVTSAGTWNFLTINGDITGPGNQVLTINRPNLDGNRWINTGSRGKPFELRAVVDILNSTEEAQYRAQYPSNQGKLATITIDTTMILSNYLILDARCLPAIPIAGAIGGLNASPAFLLESIWLVQYAYGS